MADIEDQSPEAYRERAELADLRAENQRLKSGIKLVYAEAYGREVVAPYCDPEHRDWDPLARALPGTKTNEVKVFANWVNQMEDAWALADPFGEPEIVALDETDDLSTPEGYRVAYVRRADFLRRQLGFFVGANADHFRPLVPEPVASGS